MTLQCPYCDYIFVHEPTEVDTSPGDTFLCVSCAAWLQQADDGSYQKPDPITIQKLHSDPAALEVQLAMSDRIVNRYSG